MSDDHDDQEVSDQEVSDQEVASVEEVPETESEVDEADPLPTYLAIPDKPDYNAPDDGVHIRDIKQRTPGSRPGMTAHSPCLNSPLDLVPHCQESRGALPVTRRRLLFSGLLDWHHIHMWIQNILRVKKVPVIVEPVEDTPSRGGKRKNILKRRPKYQE